MNERTAAFLADLNAVFEKHGVRLQDNDDYVGPDSTFGGYEYQLVGEDIYVTMSELGTALL